MCEKPARTVRREGSLKPIRLPYPYRDCYSPKTQPTGSISCVPIEPPRSQPNGSIGCNGAPANPPHGPQLPQGSHELPQGSQLLHGVVILGMEKIGPMLPGPAKTGSEKCGRTAMLSNPIFGIRTVRAHPLEQAIVPSRASVMTALCRTASSAVWDERVRADQRGRRKLLHVRRTNV